MIDVRHYNKDKGTETLEVWYVLMARERVDEGFHILQKGDKARGLLVGAGVKPTQ